jgi:hypothetical protein
VAQPAADAPKSHSDPPGDLPVLPTGPAGGYSESGRALSDAGRSTITLANDQLAVCSLPGHATCSAVNSARISDKTRSTVEANSAFSGVNATPQPTPIGVTAHAASSMQATEESVARVAEDAAGAGARARRRGARTMARQVYGLRLGVDMWAVWPAPNRPPMPNPVVRAGDGKHSPPYGSLVDVANASDAIDGLPPLPPIEVQAIAGSPSGVQLGPDASRKAGSGLGADSEPRPAAAVPGSWVDVDPWLIPIQVGRPALPRQLDRAVTSVPGPTADAKEPDLDSSEGAKEAEGLSWVLAVVLAVLLTVLSNKFVGWRAPPAAWLNWRRFGPSNRL